MHWGHMLSSFILQAQTNWISDQHTRLFFLLQYSQFYKNYKQNWIHRSWFRSAITKSVEQDPKTQSFTA
jgi:hypothetical protein